MIRASAVMAAVAMVAGVSAGVPTQSPAPESRRQVSPKPLDGVTIAIDPGHQLGNARFARQINKSVDAGGFRKACNTTGTATSKGIAEATVVWRLSLAVKKRLVAQGARVVLTRTSNSRQKWGPCVDARGRFGKQQGAALEVSLHADGSSAANFGFHVITPASRAPWTTDIAAPSARLARSLRDALTASGVPRSTYVGAGSGLSVRSDLGTLNLADVPISMIEIGNMRNSRDAARMTSRVGQAQYADAVVAGIGAYLKR